MYTYQYLQNFSGYSRQTQAENLRQFSYIDHAWLNTPLDPPYQEYPADMFHHLFEIKKNKWKIVIFAYILSWLLLWLSLLLFLRRRWRWWLKEVHRNSETISDESSHRNMEPVQQAHVERLSLLIRRKPIIEFYIWRLRFYLFNSRKVYPQLKIMWACVMIATHIFFVEFGEGRGSFEKFRETDGEREGEMLWKLYGVAVACILWHMIQSNRFRINNALDFW